MYLIIGGDWPSLKLCEIYVGFDFENCVMKIMSKSPSRHVVRLQLKLKKKCVFLNVNNIFSVFQYTSHQPISVADLGQSVNHVQHLIPSCLQNLCFVNFALGSECCRPEALPPFGAPMFFTQDSKIRYHEWRCSYQSTGSLF